MLANLAGAFTFWPEVGAVGFGVGWVLVREGREGIFDWIDFLAVHLHFSFKGSDSKLVCSIVNFIVGLILLILSKSM